MLERYAFHLQFEPAPQNQFQDQCWYCSLLWASEVEQVPVVEDSRSRALLSLATIHFVIGDLFCMCTRDGSSVSASISRGSRTCMRVVNEY